jgi:WhiB family redox-sensing transcriptional regulator
MKGQSGPRARVPIWSSMTWAEHHREDVDAYITDFGMTEVRDWMTRALCKSEPTSWFFPAHDKEEVKRAKCICVKCPVMMDCRQFALERFDTGGIWGGMTENERKHERKRLGIKGTREWNGRP